VKEEIRKRALEAISAIPEGYQSDRVIKETIRCVLFAVLKEQGFTPIPAFRNPRYPEGPVDMAAMSENKEIEMVFCSNALVELEDVKRLDRVPCEKRYVVTFSKNQEKVKMTTFYLKKGMEHIHLYDAS
jgi:hypothetical protein